MLWVKNTTWTYVLSLHLQLGFLSGQQDHLFLFALQVLNGLLLEKTEDLRAWPAHARVPQTLSPSAAASHPAAHHIATHWKSGDVWLQRRCQKSSPLWSEGFRMVSLLYPPNESETLGSNCACWTNCSTLAMWSPQPFVFQPIPMKNESAGCLVGSAGQVGEGLIVCWISRHLLCFLESGVPCFWWRAHSSPVSLLAATQAICSCLNKLPFGSRRKRGVRLHSSEPDQTFQVHDNKSMRSAHI